MQNTRENLKKQIKNESHPKSYESIGKLLFLWKALYIQFISSRRRPQSICSEDGRLRQCRNGSFRSAGSGCAKLKRHNACRQKSRDVSSQYSDPSSSSHKNAHSAAAPAAPASATTVSSTNRLLFTFERISPSK